KDVSKTERGRFELPRRFKPPTAFPVLLLRPLGHLSRKTTAVYMTVGRFSNRGSGPLGFFERDGADVFALAGRALFTFPQGVELFQYAVDQRGGFGPDAHLEVAPPVGLGTQAGSGEVGAAQVHRAPV